MADEIALERVEIDGGVELHCAVQGIGRPIVLVHGSLADYTYWDQANQIAPLAERFLVVAYSRRYNYPNRNEFGAAHSAAVESSDLASLLDRLGTGPAFLVGHSYGAYTALLFALSHPEQVLGLVLAEPPILPWLPAIAGAEGMQEHVMSQVWAPLGAAFTEAGDEGALDFTARWYFGVPFEQIDPLWQTLFRRNLREWRALALSPDPFPEIDRDRVRALDVPTLLISASKNAEGFNGFVDGELERLLPDVRRVIVPDASHEMFLDAPALTATLLRDFCWAT
jgi:pimeloyl-ACP methyl ester carboxylesterase